MGPKGAGEEGALACCYRLRPSAHLQKCTLRHRNSWLHGGSRGLWRWWLAGCRGGWTGSCFTWLSGCLSERQGGSGSCRRAAGGLQRPQTAFFRAAEMQKPGADAPPPGFCSSTVLCSCSRLLVGL